MWFPFNEQRSERKFSHAPTDKLDHSRLLCGIVFSLPSMLYPMYLFPGGSDCAQGLIGSVDCFTACVWCFGLLYLGVTSFWFQNVHFRGEGWPMAQDRLLAQALHCTVVRLCTDFIPLKCLSFLIPSGAITVLIHLRRS